MKISQLTNLFLVKNLLLLESPYLEALERLLGLSACLIRSYCFLSKHHLLFNTDFQTNDNGIFRKKALNRADYKKRF